MESLFSPIVAFVEANREWAPALVFLLALGETIAFVSILIPSTALLVGIGALVATGALEFMPLFLSAAAGALVGSSFSYWLGDHYGPAIARMWPLNKDPSLVQRSTDAFARWGAAAVLIGHFFGPLRAIVFAGAGFSDMKLRTFMLANVPGAILWAYLIPKSGEIGGDVVGALWRSLTGA
jgi:membrane protein DedA with SNARE-associated domain